MASGNLVISFKNGGAEEVLKNIGYLFKTNQMNDLIEKLKKIDYEEIKNKSKLSRNFTLSKFNEKTFKKKYENILLKINKF